MTPVITCTSIPVGRKNPYCYCNHGPNGLTCPAGVAKVSATPTEGPRRPARLRRRSTHRVIRFVLCYDYVPHDEEVDRASPSSVVECANRSQVIRDAILAPGGCARKAGWRPRLGRGADPDDRASRPQPVLAHMTRSCVVRCTNCVPRGAYGATTASAAVTRVFQSDLLPLSTWLVAQHRRVRVRRAPPQTRRRQVHDGARRTGRSGSTQTAGPPVGQRDAQRNDGYRRAIGVVLRLL